MSNTWLTKHWISCENAHRCFRSKAWTLFSLSNPRINLHNKISILRGSWEQFLVLVVNDSAQAGGGLLGGDMSSRVISGMPTQAGIPTSSDALKQKAFTDLQKEFYSCIISAGMGSKRSSAFKGVERRHGPSSTLNYRNRRHKMLISARYFSLDFCFTTCFEGLLKWFMLSILETSQDFF